MERLIATWTLTEDLGVGFGIGTTISTYWDDLASTYVVKKNVPTLIFGSNVATEGDSGTFEALAASWGTIGAYLTRSSAEAQTGTYSGLYTQPDGVNTLIATQSATLTAGKTYRVSCYAFVPTGTNFGHPLTKLRIIPPVNTQSSNENYLLFNTLNAWVEISIDVVVLGDTDVYDFEIRAVKSSYTIGGICYIDQFFIREIEEPTSSESTITTGPDLGIVTINNVIGYSSFNSKWFTSQYQFCLSTALVQFQSLLFNPSFPYVSQYVIPDAPSCATELIVCNLAFNGSPAIVKCSNPYSSDGEISVGATSSRSSVRYSLNDVIYSDMSNTTGVFDNLNIGSYTIYARDSANCRATVTVDLTAEITNDGQPSDPTPSYGVMYRMEHTGHYEVEERIDILERNFLGDFTEVYGSGNPFSRSLGEASINNKFDPIRPTFATINLVSERDLQYIGLFSQDDRKYLVNYYKPVGTLKWRGYVTPSVFSEPYTEAAPYYTTITVTDNLNQLEELEFLDKDSNKIKGKMTLIKIIALILNKLSLQLQIRVVLNISEDNSEYALEQVQHDAEAFYEDDGTPWTCARVLRALLMPFGAKIVQENGVWNIIRVEEQCAQYNRRLYNREGDYISADNYDPIVEIVGDASPRLNALFRDHNHTLEVVPAYGKITVVRKLYRKENQLSNGSFDINKFRDGVIEGWTVTADAASYRVAKVIREFKTDFANPRSVPVRTVINRRRSPTEETFRTQYYSIPTNVDDALEISDLIEQSTVLVQSETFPIELTNADSFVFSFNFRINMKSNSGRGRSRTSRIPDWIRINYRIQLGTSYFSDVAGWTTDDDYQWNSYYVDAYDQDQKFEIKSKLPGAPQISVRSMTITFEFFGSNYNDFTLLGVDLPDIPTIALASGTKIRGELAGVFSADYQLEDTTAATSSPDIIRPDDYDGTTNACAWILQFYKEGGTQYRDIDKLYLYDVGVKFLPNGEDGPEEEVLELVNNANYKENLIVELESGDVTELAVNNKKNLYANIFLDMAGEPTSLWTRFGVGGSNTLQRLLLSSLANQYKFPTFKVSGAILGFEDLGFLTTFKQITDQPSYSLVNGGFTGNITGWINDSLVGPDIAWAYGSNSARVTLTGAESSRGLQQTLGISFRAGDRVKINFNIERTASSGVRFDWLEIKVIGEEGVLQNLVVAEMGSDGEWTRSVRFTIIKDSTNLSFNVRNIEGTGSAQYDMDSFEIIGQSVVRYFTVNGMETDCYNNRYNVNLMQVIPIVQSADPDIDDSGEGNTGTEGRAGGGTTGRVSSSGGDYNNDYNNDYYI